MTVVGHALRAHGGGDCSDYEAVDLVVAASYGADKTVAVGSKRNPKNPELIPNWLLQSVTIYQYLSTCIYTYTWTDVIHTVDDL